MLDSGSIPYYATQRADRLEHTLTFIDLNRWRADRRNFRNSNNFTVDFLRLLFETTNSHRYFGAVQRAEERRCVCVRELLGLRMKTFAEGPQFTECGDS